MIKRLEQQVEQRLETSNKEITAELLERINSSCFAYTMLLDFEVDEIKELRGRILKAEIPPKLLLKARYELDYLGMKPDTIKAFRQLLTTPEEYERYFSSGKYNYEYDEEKLKAEQAMTLDERINKVTEYIEELKKE